MSTVPDELRLAKGSDTLTVTFAGVAYSLSAEYLRVCSPSAEVRNHGGAWTLVAGRRKVLIRRVEPVGIYTWETLHDLAVIADDYWQRYLQALAAEGKTRDEK